MDLAIGVLLNDSRVGQVNQAPALDLSQRLERLRDDVRPGTSALLLMVSNVKPHAIPTIREAMQPFRGTVYETTLSPEAQRTLHEVVEGWQNMPTP